MELKEANIKYIIVHCSDTPDNPSSRWYNMGVDVIDGWHKARFRPVCDDGKLKYVGYHYVIKKNGDIEKGRSEKYMGQHASGFNAKSIGICLIGKGKGTFSSTKFYESENGIEDIATPQQITSLKSLLSEIQNKYGIGINNIIGHHDTYPLRKKPINKACPSFSIHKFLTGNFFEWEEQQS